MESNTSRSRLASVFRWFVGLVLISTGTGKALDMPGFVHVLAAYDLLPPWVNLALAYTLPFFELATGICLVARIRLVMAAWAAAALHVMLLGAVLITLWRGIAIANCGCFGVFFARPVDAQTVVEDAVMLALSIFVLWQARKQTGEGRWKIEDGS